MLVFLDLHFCVCLALFGQVLAPVEALLERVGMRTQRRCARLSCPNLHLVKNMFGFVPCLSRSPSGALLPFFGGEFPTKIDYRKKGTLILTSPLEDLVVLFKGIDFTTGLIFSCISRRWNQMDANRRVALAKANRRI